MADETPTTPETPVKRCAIVGTASSWRHAPFGDPAVDILTLNDGYVLGLPRISVHFDLHPFHQMTFRANGQAIRPGDVTLGHYLRPAGHLDWLRSRPHPVYLNVAPPEWPTARTFPRAELEARYGSYVASTPAWMLLWALEEGYRDIGIWGVHLATQWEYVEQRPNLEFWIRHAIDRGARVTIPAQSTLLRAKHVYAYEPKADLARQQAARRVATIKAEGATLQQYAARLPWYAWDRRADVASRQGRLDAELADAHQLERRLSVLDAQEGR